MYKIIDTNSGAVIGRTKEPSFIKKSSKADCLVSTTAKDAQGIAFKGTLYNLQGRDGIGAEDTVILVEVDAGIIADQTAENSAAIDEILISMLEG